MSRLLLAQISQADKLNLGAFPACSLPRQGISVHLLALEFGSLNQLRHELLQSFVKLLKRWELPCTQQQY